MKRLAPQLLIFTGLIAFVVAFIAQLISGAPNVGELPLYGKVACYVILAVLGYIFLFYLIIPIFTRRK